MFSLNFADEVKHSAFTSISVLSAFGRAHELSFMAFNKRLKFFNRFPFKEPKSYS
jgi:hypothetical protein